MPPYISLIVRPLCPVHRGKALCTFAPKSSLSYFGVAVRNLSYTLSLRAFARQSHRSPIFEFCVETLVTHCHRKRKYISFDTDCTVYSLGLFLFGTLVTHCHQKRKYISFDTDCTAYSLGLHLCLVISH